MAAAVSTTPNLKPRRSWKTPTRRPLLPSETGNNAAAQRCPRPVSREVSSRYMSTSSSSCSTSSSTASNSAYPRSASPTPAVTPLPISSLNKRSQSADRRRPVIGPEISKAAQALMSSKRSLSMSFQGEPFATPISKTKPSSQVNSVKATPRIGGDQRNPWPASSVRKSVSKSVDSASNRKKLVARSGNGIRALRLSLDDRIDHIPCLDKLQDNISSNLLRDGAKNAAIANLLNSSISASESAASDTESVCSDSNSGSKDSVNVPRAGHRGIIVPARVWQETNNRLRHLPEPSSSLLRSKSLKATASPSPRENLRGWSPLRGGGLRSASPSRLLTPTLPWEKNIPSRAMASPTRVRNAIAGTLRTPGNTACNGPSVSCFATDVRRGKAGEEKINDAHLLRLMYNRHLQWRFANSRAEAALSEQTHMVETNLYNTWKATSDLRLSVCSKRLELSRMRLKLKLLSILKEQMIYLEEWGIMEQDHFNSLLDANKSLTASTVRLPIVCGAMADTRNLKETMCAAYDVLQAMASSICSMMSKVEQMNSLLDGVVRTVTSERAMLDECRDVLSTLAALQVKDCSLRAQNLQLQQVAASLPSGT